MIDWQNHVLRLSAQIVTAQVQHNVVATDKLPHLIRSIYNALVDVGQEHIERPAHLDHVQVGTHRGDHNHSAKIAADSVGPYRHPRYGQTVFDDHLVCMEDGLSMKMLKRHLLAVHGMTPADYREKWGLPDDYPMVATDYAKLRSSLALESGLGLKPAARGGKAGRRPAKA